MSPWRKGGSSAFFHAGFATARKNGGKFRVARLGTVGLIRGRAGGEKFSTPAIPNDLSVSLPVQFPAVSVGDTE
jgi:hypothetical protein